MSFADSYSGHCCCFFTTKKKKIDCLQFFFRLLQILERDSDKGRSEPFRTYESLGQVAHKLAGDLQTTRDALAGAAREQHYSAARLNGDCEALHRAMYTELQQLNLGPQVCPLGTTDQELLCPNAQVGFFLCTRQQSTSEYNLEETNNVSWISLFFSKGCVTSGKGKCTTARCFGGNKPSCCT